MVGKRITKTVDVSHVTDIAICDLECGRKGPWL